MGEEGRTGSSCPLPGKCRGAAISKTNLVVLGELTTEPPNDPAIPLLETDP